MFRNDRLFMPGHDENRQTALMWLAQQSVGVNSLDELFVWMNREDCLSHSSYVDQNHDIPWIHRICHNQGWEVPSTFQFHPLNSRALLFHWRVLVPLLVRLSPALRLEFRAMKPLKTTTDTETSRSQKASPAASDEEIVEFETLDQVGFEDEEEEILSEAHEDLPPPYPLETSVFTSASLVGLSAIDSHFHLDRATSEILGTDRPLSIPALLEATVSANPRLPVDVVGGVCVFCDPAPTHRSSRRTQDSVAPWDYTRGI